VIHPSSVVSPKAQLGADVEIGPFCVVNDNVTIGDRCRLHSHVAVDGHTTIGADNEFYPFAAIGQRSQDLKYQGEPTTLLIGDRNTFRENVTIHRGTREIPTTIGSDNNFLAYSHVAHDCTVGSHCVFSNNATLGGHVSVEDYVIISGLSGVHQFCRIGAHVIIGGCTKIVKDVPPFLIADGHPAALRGLNLVGLQRRGFSPEAIRGLKQSYKALFLKKEANLASQIASFQSHEAAAIAEVARTLAFIEASERGIVR
jgi:UDP-N-acetylglucosamine acyltransferase